MAFEYWGFLIKKLLGQDPFNKPKKFAYKETPKVKEKPYVKPKPVKHDGGIKLGFNPRFSVAGIIIPVIMLIVGITVFSEVSSSLNMSSLGSPALVSMMGLVPLIFVAVVGMGIITSILRFSM